MKIKLMIAGIMGSLEPLSAASHGLAAIASYFGMIVLIHLSHVHGTFLHFVANTVFMSSMLALYLASAVYHLFPLPGKWKLTFRRIDQAMIYVLIAGTYTPLCLIALKDEGGVYLLAAMWLIAIMGVFLKIKGVDFSNFWQTFIYAAMGIVGGVKIGTTLSTFQDAGLAWFVAGGATYISGAICYVAGDKLDPNDEKYYHEAFHLLVMAGSACHYWLMLQYLVHL